MRNKEGKCNPRCQRNETTATICYRRKLSRSSSEILMVSSGLFQVGCIYAGQGPLAGEGTDLVAELLHLSEALFTLLLGGSNADEVLKELRAGLLLEKKSELDSTVKEVGNNLDILLLHVTGGQSGGTKADATRHLGRSITRNSVL